MMQILQRALLVAVCLASFLPLTVSAEPDACSTERARAFIDDTAQQILTVMLDEQLDAKQRHSAYIGILRKTLGSAKIARSLAGPYWRKMSRRQQEIYVAHTTDVLLYTMADYINSAKVSSYKILQSSRLGKDFLVKTSVFLPEENLTVSWRVRCFSSPPDSLLLVDFLFRGVSLTSGLRSYTSTVIARSGVPSYLALLEQKRKALIEKTR